MDEQKFMSLLEALLKPDTNTVKQATSELNKNWYSHPQSVTALIQILINSQSAELRQLASVEARKLVKKHWTKLSADEKPHLRDQLLQSAFSEEKQLLRHSKARVVASIASIDLEDGQWQELPGLLQQAATSADARHREVGVYIIYTLLETMPDIFQENIGPLLQLFNHTIADPTSLEVRTNTMLALSELAMVLDTEEDEKSLKLFQETIPKMVKVLQSAIEAEDEEHSMQAFDVFNKLLSYESAFLNPHFGNLLQFFMQVSANKDFDDDVRSQALSFLMQSVRFRKLKCQSLKVGEPMTKMCVEIATELGDPHEDDDDDISPARSALGLLDILSESLPPSQVAVPLLKTIGPYVQSQSAAHRRAGILSLGMCVEGAPDFIATQLHEILPLVLHLLEDPDTTVRSAALNGVARLGDDLAEDMGKEHAKLIPALVRNYDLAVQGVRNNAADSKEHAQNLLIIKASAMAVDAMIEGLEQADAALYVNELVPRFSTLLDYDDPKVQMAAVSALGSIASASEDAFTPFFQQTMRGMGEYISIKDSQDDLELRAMTMDSLGKIASAVGAQTFQQFVEPLMHSSEEGLKLDHQRLKETSFILWSSLAQVYQEEFAPFLSGVMTSLFACLEQDETDAEINLGAEASDLVGQEVTIAGKKIKVAGANGVSVNDITDPNMDDDAVVQALIDGAAGDDDDDDDWDDFGAVTGVAMEKEIALEVVGDVLTHTKAKYLPYMEKTIATIVPLLEHNFEGVRKSAVGSLWRAYACVWGLAEDGGMQKWKPGMPVKVEPTADLKKLGEIVMTSTLGVWEDEMDRGTVTEINRHVAATLKLCGPAILTPSADSAKITPLEQIAKFLLQILQKQHPCQKDEDDMEADDPPLDEESAEYDWLVIETALEVIASLSAAIGGDFAQLWKLFEKPILKYASSQERFERSAAVGTIGECVEGMGDACTPYTGRLMPVFKKRLGDEDPEVKSNAAFGAGLLCLNSNDAKEVLSSYPIILTSLEPILAARSAEPKDAEARLLDNAAGCVSRMIKKSPQNVPLEDVLPRLVEILPLKEDYRENEPVFDMIVSLYQAQNEVMHGLTTQLMPVFEQVLGPPDEQLSDDLKGKVTQLVQYLRSH